jgi:small-conductance mechanosensitive channel
VFVSDLVMYRRLRHNLHLAIDDSFRQHGIEIAFPQCDIHIKDMPRVASKPTATSLPSEVLDSRTAAA